MYAENVPVSSRRHNNTYTWRENYSYMFEFATMCYKIFHVPRQLCVLRYDGQRKKNDADIVGPI